MIERLEFPRRPYKRYRINCYCNNNKARRMNLMKYQQWHSLQRQSIYIIELSIYTFLISYLPNYFRDKEGTYTILVLWKMLTILQMLSLSLGILSIADKMAYKEVTLEESDCSLLRMVTSKYNKLLEFLHDLQLFVTSRNSNSHLSSVLLSYTIHSLSPSEPNIVNTPCSSFNKSV